MEELLKIAKEKYPVGTVFKSAYNSDNIDTVVGDFVQENDGDIHVDCHNTTGVYIYFKKRWGEIISKPEVKEVEKERSSLFFEEMKERGIILKNNINPSHYSSGKIECIDAIESALSPEEFKGFLRGNIIKYNWRCMKKNGVEDLKKAQWYLNRLIKTLENATTRSN